MDQCWPNSAPMAQALKPSWTVVLGPDSTPCARLGLQQSPARGSVDAAPETEWRAPGTQPFRSSAWCLRQRGPSRPEWPAPFAPLPPGRGGTAHAAARHRLSAWTASARSTGRRTTTSPSTSPIGSFGRIRRSVPRNHPKHASSLILRAFDEHVSRFMFPSSCFHLLPLAPSGGEHSGGQLSSVRNARRTARHHVFSMFEHLCEGLITRHSIGGRQ